MQDLTFLIAIYGALISSLLAAIKVYEFSRAQRVLEIRPVVSFSEGETHYRFSIINVGDRDVTLIECMVDAIYQKVDGVVEADWGIGPYQVPSLWDDFEGQMPKPLQMPHIINSGGAVFIEVLGSELRTQFSSRRADGWANKSKPGWTPIGKIRLELEHSRSRKPVTIEIALESDEHLDKRPDRLTGA